VSDTLDTNWRRDLEENSIIRELTKPKVPKAFRSYSIPDEVRCDVGPNPHKLENQGAMGSCGGFAISSCVEQLNTIATGGDRTQLSAIFSYIAAQKITGSQLYGRDSGSTISAGVQLATTTGICPQELAKYPHPVRYPNQAERNKILKQSNYDAGEPYKIRSSVGIKSYEDAKNWIGSGGVISIGIAWSPRFKTENGRKVVTSIARNGGGHALSVAGYRRNGNMIFINSHDYFFEVPPALFGQMLKHNYTVAIGLSDMANPTPRDLSYLKKSRKKRLGNIRELW